MNERVEHLFSKKTKKQENIRQNKLPHPLLNLLFRFSSMSILVARHLQQERSQRRVGQGRHGLEDKVQQFRNGVQKRCSEIIRTRNFTIFTAYATIFGQFTTSCHFFLITLGKYVTSCWTFWKGSLFNPGPSEKFLIVGHPKEDHNEWEFKR